MSHEVQTLLGVTFSAIGGGLMYLWGLRDGRRRERQEK